MGKLTALKIRNLKEPGRYTDGRGLMLVIGADGSRKWVLRVQYAGRRRDIGLGPLADVSLADARDEAADLRKAIRDGRDPVAERRLAREVIPTFRVAAERVHKEHMRAWKNEKHAAQWLSTLDTYAFPKLGDTRVDQVTGPMVRDVLAEIWLTIPETARRVRQRIGAVLDYSHAKGWRESEAPMRSVTKGLPKHRKTEKHHAALPWQDLPDFVTGMADKLSASEPVLLALEFLILTAARSGEVREMRSSEVDLKAETWTVPAGRMKAGKAHRVPLSDRAVEILRRMEEYRRARDRDPLVFEGSKPGKPFSDMTWTRALRRANLDITVHGFRSSFRDWLSEATNTPREVAEACLAHTLKDKTEAAYARSDLFDKRRAVMDQWALFVTGAGGNVVPLNRNRP